jgi:hypothetical protein
MSRADQIVSRLSGVKKRRAGGWMAKCPAHEDRSASLAIAETDDGVVLLHCFAECEPLDVLGAIGLEMTDLYPERLEHQKPYPGRVAWSGDAMRALTHELRVVEILAADMARGEFNPELARRAQQAAERIRCALRMCHG